MRRFAVARKEENKVDVGGEVQLATTELAHAHDDKRHRRAVGILRGTVACRGDEGRDLGSESHGVVGERRKVLQRFLEGGAPAQVAPGDAHHFAAAPAA